LQRWIIGVVDEEAMDRSYGTAAAGGWNLGFGAISFVGEEAGLIPYKKIR
jgi:hypothetical protein